MKINKLLISLLTMTCFVSCGSNNTVSSNSSSSLDSSSSEESTSLNQTSIISSISNIESSNEEVGRDPYVELENALNEISTFVEYNVIIYQKSSEYYQGVKYKLYKNDNEYGYAMLNLSVTDSDTFEVKNGDLLYADLSGDNEKQVYSEYLGPDNEVKREYLLNALGKPYKYNEVCYSPFSYIQENEFTKIEDNKYKITKNSDSINFLYNVVGYQGYSDDFDTIFSLENNHISKVQYEDDKIIILVKDIVLNENIVPNEHVAKLTEDTSDKTNLKIALDKFNNTSYTVTHYRTGEKTKVYYLEDKIIVDHDANGLDNQDELYQKDSLGMMYRQVYGQYKSYGPTCWDKDNYTTMNYSDNKTYDDLRLRYDQLSLGLFKNNGDGTYETIEGAAKYVFAYCQPTPNVRQLYVDNAIKVKFYVENQTITQVKLTYNYSGATGTTGFDKTDTLKFENVGCSYAPLDYRHSFDLSSYELTEDIIGIWEGAATPFEQEKSISIKLVINKDKSVEYYLDNKKQDVSRIVFFEETYEDKIYYSVEFTYKNDTRGVRLQMTYDNPDLEGADSNLNDVFDFFNMTLIKD